MKFKNVVRMSVCSNTPQQPTFQLQTYSRDESLLFGDAENSNAGETHNGQAEDKILGSLSSDKQCGCFLFEVKDM
jgi:hypothetical protein